MVRGNEKPKNIVLTDNIEGKHTKMKIGKKEFNLNGNEAYIMGILNVTPDSFSDGGKFNEIDQALFQAEKMIKDGAAIIDVGGESTRPNYTMISDEEEIERVLPVIEKLKENFDTPISLDTYKSKVAQVRIQAGVDLINDIWGLKWDEDMAKVIARGQVAACLMHNRKEAKYHRFMEEVLNDLEDSVEIAIAAGMDMSKIILDPGVGFAKDLSQNLEVIKQIDQLHSLGFPILLGTSRKSVIGLSLDLPVDQREEGTIATTVIGRMKGCKFFRVHNVEANYRALKMTEAILY